jgi:hypothetical protein
MDRFAMATGLRPMYKVAESVEWWCTCLHSTGSEAFCQIAMIEQEGLPFWTMEGLFCV